MDSPLRASESELGVQHLRVSGNLLDSARTGETDEFTRCPIVEIKHGQVSMKARGIANLMGVFVAAMPDDTPGGRPRAPWTGVSGGGNASL